MIVRDAQVDDLAGILVIYNDVIATSTAIYTFDPVDIDDRKAWLAERRRLGYPVLVAVDDSGILGFASFGDFRPYWGYRHTVEHSVHVRSDCRGKGVGRRLLEALIAPARALGKHAMIGVVDAENQASILFHQRLGFEAVGRLRQVGHKFDRWLDITLMQRLLDEPVRPG